MLSAFGGGELLDINIATLRPIVFLLSLACPCLFNDDIKSEQVDNRHTRGGGGGVKLLHNSNCSSYTLSIHIT